MALGLNPLGTVPLGVDTTASGGTAAALSGLGGARAGGVGELAGAVGALDGLGGARPGGVGALATQAGVDGLGGARPGGAGVLQGYPASTIIVGSGGTVPGIKNNTGALQASSSGWTVFVHNLSTRALIASYTGRSTDASGLIVITDATNLTTGVTVLAVLMTPDGLADACQRLTPT